MAVFASAVLAGDAEPVSVSGIYPHLAVFNDKQGECGIGGIVPWAGKLWLLTYPPHMTKGSPDKLYEVDDKLNMVIRPESVGGTHASRMIHRESNQLIIGPYFIDDKGTVRVADLSKLVGRMTAAARHLTDPANLVYLYDMEGAVYEVNVRTLDVKRLFEKPVPGWHGKGGYTSQGRLVVANNGEHPASNKKYEFLAGELPKGPEDAGVLAEWDGKQWRIIERRQFLDVTGPGGIFGAPDDKSPLWAIGWDKRSVMLKLLDGGAWSTFRVPKASHCFDPKHGWYTEWPRIREIAPGKALMIIHGMMYDFPLAFCAANTAGIAPVCSHLRYVTDVCTWNGRLLVSSDDASVMKNPMAGQSQSNIWFGSYDALKTFGPRAGWGGVWIGDAVKANEPSVPFLVNGFERRCLHLAVGGAQRQSAEAGGRDGAFRCTGALPLTEIAPELAGLTRVTIGRGDFHKPAPGYSFTVNQDVVVFLAVDSRPKAELGEGWEKTALKTAWRQESDDVYKKSFKAGKVEIPGHPAEHKPRDYGVPHLCFVKPAADGAKLEIAGFTDGLNGRTYEAAAGEAAPLTPPSPARGEGVADVTFTIEMDAAGNGKWTEYKQVAVGKSGYQFHIFPPEFKAQWIRVKASRDCAATAYLHLSAPWPHALETAPLFHTLAGVSDTAVVAGPIRPAGHNRNLQWVPVTVEQGAAKEGAYVEVNEKLAFETPADNKADDVKKVCEVAKDFEVDAASVIMTQKGKRYRLPKGAPQFDKPFAAGWPRCIREVASERYLFNAHGTFYEMPRDDGLDQIKPVCSHAKQIMDYCTWRGVLVISGTRKDAKPDGQFFAGPSGAGLWFGQVDDLWKLGKPVGKGGPWLETAVKAGEPSDPYLMTNYDKKTVQFSHDAAGPVEFTLEVDVNHFQWVPYQTITVPAGEKVSHVFPEGYNAHWVRVKANKDCKATATFVYE
jgi:hypothetical protein